MNNRSDSVDERAYEDQLTDWKIDRARRLERAVAIYNNAIKYVDVPDMTDDDLIRWAESEAPYETEVI